MSLLISEHSPFITVYSGQRNIANMDVCKNRQVAYLRMKDDIHCLVTEIREKNKLIDGSASVASVQAKHISYMQSSTLADPVVQLSSTIMPQAFVLHHYATGLDLGLGCHSSLVRGPINPATKTEAG